MERNLCWTNRALGQLDETATYIAKDHQARATTFVTELRKKVDILKSHQFGKAGRVFGTFVSHANYLSVYRVKDDEVQIITSFPFIHGLLTTLTSSPALRHWRMSIIHHHNNLQHTHCDLTNFFRSSKTTVYILHR